MTEIGWTDQHGDGGHILLGRERVREYAPPRLGPDWLDKDVLAIIEVQTGGEPTWRPVYLPRVVAETLYSALATALASGDEDRPA
jgi:hypothetical protein